MKISKTFLDKINKLPDIIDSEIIMNKPNESINIYKGNYLIKNDSSEITIKGTIKYDWYPNSGTHFYGELTDNKDEFTKLSLSARIRVLIDGLEFGEGFITRKSYGDTHDIINIEGIISGQSVLGDKSIHVNKLKFTIPNFRHFHGRGVKRIVDKNISSLSNRMIFEDDNYIITIDKNFDFEERKNLLDINGGYFILYAGELKNKKGAISIPAAQDICECLNIFLTFLNGRRISVLFIQGIYENDVIWSDYSSYFVDNYKPVFSWPSYANVDCIEKLWNKFIILWKDKENRNFIKSLVHWYVEANSQSGAIEGSIIMAQTGLELIYNWWIIENKKLIMGNDSANISASNKVRLILSQLKIDPSVFPSLTNLTEYCNKESIIDGPEVIVQIRNAIVHSQVEKRKKLSEIPDLAKYEALQLSIWYIEMSLLRILDFDDKYLNRCSTHLKNLYETELVPWSESK